MKVTVYFLNGNTELMENHYSQKEYRDDIIVEIDGLFFEVYFFVEGMLKYEMTNDGFFSFPGIIILDEMSSMKIINSIEKLIDYGYFNSFVGHRTLPLNERFVNRWYLTGDGAFTGKDLDKINLRS